MPGLAHRPATTEATTSDDMARAETTAGTATEQDLVGNAGVGERLAAHSAGASGSAGSFTGVTTAGAATQTDAELERHRLLEAASFASYLNQDEVEAWGRLNGSRSESGQLQREANMDQDTFDRLQQRDRYMQVVTDAGYTMQSYSDDQGLENGMAFSTLVDANADDDEDLAPILAFRGTEASGGALACAQDLLTDFDHRGVGYTQFENDTNQEILHQALADAGADQSEQGLQVTGHSLGGANGERFVARNGDQMNISELVTFNGAGTSEDVVDEYAEHGGAVPVHRHVVEDVAGADDIVQVAGHHLASTVHHHRGGDMQGQTHLATPLLDYDDYEHSAPERMETTHNDRMSREMNAAHSVAGFAAHVPEMMWDDAVHDVRELSQLGMDQSLGENLGHLAATLEPSDLQRGLWDGATGLADMAVDNVAGGIETARDLGTGAARWGRDRATEAADTATHAWDQTTDWASDTAHQAADTATHTWDQTTDQASDTAHEAADTATHAWDRTTDWAGDTARHARRATSNRWNSATDSVRNWFD